MKRFSKLLAFAAVLATIFLVASCGDLPPSDDGGGSSNPPPGDYTEAKLLGRWDAENQGLRSCYYLRSDGTCGHMNENTSGNITTAENAWKLNASKKTITITYYGMPLEFEITQVGGTVKLKSEGGLTYKSKDAAVNGGNFAKKPPRLNAPVFGAKSRERYLDIYWSSSKPDGYESITIDGYKLYRVTHSELLAAEVLSDTKEIRYKDEGLISGLTYYYYVEAYNEYGSSEPGKRGSDVPK